MIQGNYHVVIVTGGAQGIGKGIVQYLLQRGIAVVAADRDQNAGAELLEELGYREALSFTHTDVGEEQQVQACIAHTIGRFGRITGLVNNAGIAQPGNTPVTELALESWERMLRTNLTGAFLMAKHAGQQLQKNRGAIVNIASTRALQSEPHTEAYSASKGGLVSLTHALAVSFSGKVRVNAVLPGWIDVSRHQKRAARYELQLTPADHGQHPAGRGGVPEDVASLTAFLLGDEAGFITGQQFVVDGGMTRKMIYVE